jgi:hypothetical protein
MAKLGSAGFEVDINSPLLTEAPIIGGVYPETVTLKECVCVCVRVNIL